MENYIGKICPFCRTAIHPGEAIIVCPACGIPHHESCWAANKGCTTFGCSQKYQPPQPEAAPAYPTQNAPAPAAAGAVCATCGTPMAEGQSFCAKCGAPRPVVKKLFCSQCGTELTEGQAFCAKCGQKAAPAMDADVNTAINQFNANIEKKSKKKGLVPIIIGAAAALILAIVLIVVLSGPSVDEIILSESSIELREDASFVATYIIEPNKASDVEVKWKSSDTSVATVNSSGKITAKGEGTCTITVSAGGESDSMTVTVKSGPDFKALYNEYCAEPWAEYGYDGSYLSIDTNPYDWDDDGLAYPEAFVAVMDINAALGLPDSLVNDMSETTGADGKQTEVFDGVTVTWKYHPDRGLEVTYKAN